MKIIRGGIALMLLAAITLASCGGAKSSTPIATTTDACIGATSKWALWSGGTCLRGANVWQTVNIPSFYGGTLGTGLYGPPFSQPDFDALAATGANVVNLSHPGIFSEIPDSTGNYVLNNAALANLNALLGMVKKANMFAVITFRTGPGRNEEDIVPQAGLTPLNSVWSNTTAQNAWVAMWQYAANLYKNEPVVVGYDLMNEPHPNAQAVTPVPTSTPSQFYPQYANAPYDWNPLAKKISDAIRQVDTTTPILIGGMDWSGAAWLNSLTSNGDSKTVYMVHQYEPQASYTHQPTTSTNTYGTTASSCGLTPCSYTRNDLLTQFHFISSFKTARNTPAGVNEFGVMRYQPGAAQYLTDEMDIMESIGVNYSIWDWETTDLAFATVGLAYDHFNYRKGIDPNNHVDVPLNANVLTTVLQKYFQKNTVRPSNRSF
ncbi:MAG: cellulase family glycosylhydrolase [Nitrosomonadales bacterium]|nr:cellulase family glycosylhydrolase [Nitrosomonadales bacterium]